MSLLFYSIEFFGDGRSREMFLGSSVHAEKCLLSFYISIYKFREKRVLLFGQLFLEFVIEVYTIKLLFKFHGRPSFNFEDL